MSKPKAKLIEYIGNVAKTTISAPYQKAADKSAEAAQKKVSRLVPVAMYLLSLFSSCIRKLTAPISSQWPRRPGSSKQYTLNGRCYLLLTKTLLLKRGSVPHRSRSDPDNPKEVIAIAYYTVGETRLGAAHIHEDGTQKFSESRFGRLEKSKTPADGGTGGEAGGEAGGVAGGAAAEKTDGKGGNK
jgi:hypothetical protein